MYLKILTFEYENHLSVFWNPYTKFLLKDSKEIYNSLSIVHGYLKKKFLVATVFSYCVCKFHKTVKCVLECLIC